MASIGKTRDEYYKEMYDLAMDVVRDLKNRSIAEVLARDYAYRKTVELFGEEE